MSEVNAIQKCFCALSCETWALKNQHYITQYILIFLSGAEAGSPGLVMLGNCSTPELQPQLCVSVVKR